MTGKNWHLTRSACHTKESNNSSVRSTATTSREQQLQEGVLADASEQGPLRVSSEGAHSAILPDCTALESGRRPS